MSGEESGSSPRRRAKAAAFFLFSTHVVHCPERGVVSAVVASRNGDYVRDCGTSCETLESGRGAACLTHISN